MHNKIKSENHSAVKSATRVAVFWASLEIVRRMVGAQLSNSDYK